MRKMSLGLVSWKLLFLFLVNAYTSGAREMTEKDWKGLDQGRQKELSGSENFVVNDLPNGNAVLRLPTGFGAKGHSMDHANKELDAHQELHMKDVDAHPSSHSPSPHSHMKHSSMFFTINDLKVGTTFDTNLPMYDPSNSPHLMPREEADSIPFSLKELPYLLDLFSYPPDSPLAKAMEDALRSCESEPIKGETKICATSLESMLDYARSVFGLETDFQVLSTTHLTKSTATSKNYTILAVPKEISATKMVACHTMSYPYTIFFCHSQESKNKLLKISLGAEDGDRVETVAVCHMDTSQWNPDHISFRLLGIKPGRNSTVCHFFPTDNLVFVPKST